MIPPEHNSSFVAHMERVLDVYKRPFDPLRPVVCMDESPKHLIAETRVPIPGLPGRVARHDYEYRRCGVCTVFLASEPLAGKRMVRITERRTKRDWAHFLEEIADQYESAEKITLVMDNLNTHVPGSLYEAFAPDKAKALWDRFDFVPARPFFSGRLGWVRSIKPGSGFSLALLEGEDHGVVRRIHVDAHHVVELLDEAGIAGELEASDLMGL